MTNLLMASVENMTKNTKVPMLRPGDTVRVMVRIVEGDRERLQPYQGVVIRIRKGPQANFTVRRIAAHGVGVERTFLTNSPRLESVTILRHSKVRRARLYYLRDLQGKKARLKERRFVNAPQIAESLAEPEATDTATV